MKHHHIATSRIISPQGAKVECFLREVKANAEERTARGRRVPALVAAKKKFVRTGIVIRLEETGYTWEQRAYFECVTFEGNIDPGMTRNGGLTLRHYRRLSSERKDQFIRWTSLDVRGERAATQLPRPTLP